MPTREYRFKAGRKWEFDLAWPEYMVALEIEGGVFTRGRHTQGVGFMQDMEKYNTATVMGWRILRCTPDQLITAETVRMIWATLTWGGMR